MKKIIILLLVACALLLAYRLLWKQDQPKQCCGNACKSRVECTLDSALANPFSAGECQFTLGLNTDNAQIETLGDTLVMTAGEQTDFFLSPQDSSIVATSPIILTAVDNTKPFTFTAKVTPEFTPDGTYAAGTLYAYERGDHWQKLAFEQSEDGLHRIVTVRTKGLSDDNNHQIETIPAVYLRISSDTRAIGSYYSEDGQTWHMARLCQNDYPEQILLGLSAQSPKVGQHRCTFTEVEIKQQPVADFREGKL